MFNTANIEALAKEQGLSNSFLAKKIGKNTSLFVDWRKGKSKPSDADIQKLALLLNTTPEYLLGKTDTKEKPADSADFSDTDILIAKKIAQLTVEEKLKLEGYVDILLLNK